MGKIRHNSPVVCQICSKRLERLDSLKKHLSRQHNEFIGFLRERTKKNFDFCINDLVKKHKNDIYIGTSIIEEYKIQIKKPPEQLKRSSIFSYFQREASSSKGDSSTSNHIDQELQQVIEGNSDSNSQVSRLENSHNDHDYYSSNPLVIQQEILNSQDTSNFQGIEVIAKFTEGFQKSINNAEKKLKQLKFEKTCTTCFTIEASSKNHKDFIKSLLDKCACKKKNCCCQRFCEKTLIPDVPDVDRIKENLLLDSDTEFFKKCDQRNDIRYYCVTCHRYSKSPGKHFSDGGDWVINGVCFTKKEKFIPSYKKKHLASEQHKESLIRQKNDDVERELLGLPLVEECERATEKQCIVAQFIIDNSCTYRMLPQLGALLYLILPSGMNPIGNQHLNKSFVRHFIKANFCSIRETLREQFKIPLQNTKLERRLMVSVDKGTSFGDANRQAICGTFITDEGKPKVLLVSVGRIYEGDAKSAMDNVQQYCSQIFNTKFIAVLCTDSASTYVGEKSGMHARMKKSPEFSSKLLLLNDVCHKAERLLENTMPKWIKDTLEKSNTFAHILNKSPKIYTALKDFSNTRNDLAYTEIPSMVTTRYVEYGHRHINAILNNLQIFSECLPKIISKSSQENIKEKARNMHNTVFDPLFIAKLELINSVFINVSVMEKAAQSETLNPFEHKAIITKLFETLECKTKKYSIKVNKLLKDGKFKHNYSHYGKKYHVSIDFNAENSINSVLYNCRGKDVLLYDFRKWITCILSSFDEYLKLPLPVVLSISLFSLNNVEELDLTERVESYRKLFAISNTVFLECSQECLGLNLCTCVEKEIKRFFDYIIINERSEWLKDPDEGIKYNYNEVFSYFFKDSNIPRIKITNMVRLLEITLLLKPSQASTERVMSVVANTVHQRFENRYKDREVEEDVVFYSVFCKVNANMKSLDARKARQYFISQHHNEAFKKTKNKKEISSSVYKELKSMTVSSIMKKRKRETLNFDKAYDVDTVSNYSYDMDDPAAVEDNEDAPLNHNEDIVSDGDYDDLPSEVDYDGDLPSEDDSDDYLYSEEYDDDDELLESSFEDAPLCNNDEVLRVDNNDGPMLICKNDEPTQIVYSNISVQPDNTDSPQVSSSVKRPQDNDVDEPPKKDTDILQQVIDEYDALQGQKDKEEDGHTQIVFSNRSVQPDNTDGPQESSSAKCPQDDDEPPENDMDKLQQVSDGYDTLQGQKEKEEDGSTQIVYSNSSVQHYNTDSPQESTQVQEVIGEIQTEPSNFNAALESSTKRKIDIKKPESPRKRAKATSKVNELFCVCHAKPGEYSNETYIGCANARKCESRIGRLATLNVQGGDWFHYRCVDLDPSHPPKGNWFCCECQKSKKVLLSTYRSLLIQDLNKEKRQLYSVKKDENCLFACFSYDMYGNPKLHDKVRENLMNKLEGICRNCEYENFWKFAHTFSENELENPEVQFIRKVVTTYRKSFFKENESNAQEITLERRLEYISAKRDPNDDSVICNEKVQKRYGTGLEIDLYSLSENKNVWVLDHYSNTTGPIHCIFKWNCHSFPNSFKRSHEDLIANTNYTCLFKDTSKGSKYWSMVGLKKALKKSEISHLQLPNCKTYEYSTHMP